MFQRIRHALGIKFKRRLTRWQAWFERNERIIIPFALFGGFVFDFLTLTRIDQLYENIVLFGYLALAATGITFVHFYESWTYHRLVQENGFIDRALGYLHAPTPFIIQFAFGALFSGFSVFYMRSGAFTASWPWFLVLGGLMVGNEFFRKQYIRLSFQVGVLFFALFSYAIFSVPMLVGTIGWWVFLLSGVLSLLAIFGFMYFLRSIIPTRFNQSKNGLIATVISVFAIVNVFYFTNILPPIPLSLKDISVYHQVIRSDGAGYIVEGEPRPWYDFFTFSQTHHVTDNGDAYVFSSVFAPTGLETQIVHHWRYYDDAVAKWVDRGSISFTVVGGRDGGFRGYSRKSGITPGGWRVDVETSNGQLIGRIRFDVVRVSEAPERESRVIR
ncbi:MAG: DUF2914 domain-containing protein [Candidatus Paceibacterota bacterium]